MLQVFSRSPVLMLMLPAWLALLFYLPTLAHGYVWDDTYFLTDLPYLRDPALWWQAIREPLFVSHNYFRPLPLLMFVAEVRLGGPGAFVFHLVNVLLHMLNTTLLVLLARGAMPADRRGQWLASMAGVLFALHPALVENVSWISDRFDLLMTTFILIALYAELSMSSRIWRALLQAVCLLGALLSKETGIVLLGLLPLWQVFLHRAAGGTLKSAARLWWQQRWLYTVLLVTIGIYLGLRFAALGFLYHSDTQMTPGQLVPHLLLVGKTFGTYLLLLVWPFGQVSPVHPAQTPLLLNDGFAWFGLLALLSVLAAIGVGLWRGAASAVLALLALVALAPVGNLLPLTIGDNIAHDRYLIIPIAFVALLLARVLHASTINWPRWPVIAWLFAASVCTFVTVPRWQNNLSLWEWAYAAHPQSQIASGNYLLALLDAQRDQEALVLATHLLAARQPASFSATLRHSRALALVRTGDLAQAEIEIKLRLDEPRRDDAAGRYGVSEALNLLAHIQLKQSRYAAAEKNLNEAIRLTPYLPRPHYNLALVLYAQGRVAMGDAQLETALRYASPSMAEAFRRTAADARTTAAAVSKQAA